MKRPANPLRSMTSYGRASAAGPNYSITVSVRSVNHRFLQIGLRLPPELSECQERISEQVRRAVARGKVDVTVDLELSASARYEVEVNQAVVDGVLQGLRSLARRHRLGGELSADALLRVPNAIVVRPRALRADARFLKLLDRTVAAALRSFTAMRVREGAALLLDLRRQLKQIGAHRQKIAAEASGLRERYQERLRERLKRFNQGLELDEERLLKEAAYLAERADISEELVRLGSHLQQAERYLDEGGAQGKRLEFLIQELHRESNTIADKTSSLEVVARIVEVKAAVERMREQVQNLE